MTTKTSTSMRHDERSADEGNPHRPPGAPDWITADVIERSLRVWQTYYREPLTNDDAVEMLRSVRRLADVLQAEGRRR